MRQLFFFELRTLNFSHLSLANLLGRSVSASSSAVGLSALSLLASASLRLAKDAAPIPNAEDSAMHKVYLETC